MTITAATKLSATVAVLALSSCMAAAQSKVFVTSAHGTVRMTGSGSASYMYRTDPAGEGEGQSNKTHDELFAGTEQFEKNATSVTEIDMGPDSLDEVRGVNASAARSTLLNVVRTYSYDKPGMYDMAAVDKYREKLNSGEWHCSVHTRELKTGESTDVCQRRRSDDLREDAIITVGPKELTFIHHIKRNNGGGHSTLSELPMMIGPQINGLIAELNPGSVAELKTWQAEHMAEMKALQAEMKAGIGSVGDLSPGRFWLSSPDADVRVIKLDRLKKVMPPLPPVPVPAPEAHSIPAPPAAPSPLPEAKE